LTLNTDGKRHPVVNAAAAYTVLAGLASFVLGMYDVSTSPEPPWACPAW